jgi:epoxyqueuosine reductase QueG
MKPLDLADLISETIKREVKESDTVTRYREPIIGFVAANDPGFSRLSELTEVLHMMPDDLLPGARSVVCFFLPFAPEIAYANAEEEERVAREWGVVYVETNTMIGQITARLIKLLSQSRVRAAAERATGNFDEAVLRSHWSHKSIAALTGIGSFGLHQLVITDAGCAGRFGSLVIDAELPINIPKQKERCEYYDMGTCLDCMLKCPVDAIDEEEPFNRLLCWEQCLKNASGFLDLGDDVHICGKCAVVGPCALKSAV